MQNNKIILRAATEEDISSIIKLYADTVRSINAKDYPPEHIRVWAEGSENIKRWLNAVKEQYFLLAFIKNNLAGFASITLDGYLDFMYVSKYHQRIGVAKTLLEEIEHKASEQKNAQIYSHVSKTARGLFEKFGYKHIRDLTDSYKGVVFINALMVKKL